jgi:glycosyltransferase involved in cell wall biosynthesis
MNLSIDLKVAGIAAKLAHVPRIIYRRGSAIPIKNKPLNRFLFRNVITDIIANSEATRNTILENNSNLFPLEKIKVIYNGLDFCTRKSQTTTSLYTKKEEEIILGNAGRMVYQKGHEYLIAIAAKLKEKGVDFKLLLAGTGPLESKIREQVKQVGLTNEVVFLGFVNDIAQFMNSIDIFLLTSRWEGFGFVLAEAMAAGKPLVAFDISSNPELVVNNTNGYLVKPFDVEDFASKTIQLVQNKEQCKKMGEKGKTMAHEKFSFDRAVKELKAILNLNNLKKD